MPRISLVAKRGLILALLPVFLLPIVAPLLPSSARVAYALSPGSDTLLIKRLVIAQLDRHGRLGHLVLNITDVNELLNLSNITRLCNATATGMQLNVSIKKIYELNTTTRKMVFAEITLYNETYSYSFYILAYRAEHPGFNVTIVTRIITDPETGNYKYFLTVANIEPRKENPVADVIVVPNETTLSQHYRILAKTLMKISRGDRDTRTIWPKIAMELRHLSVLVEKHLGRYDAQKAESIAIVIDGYWDCVAECLAENFMQGIVDVCLDVCIPCLFVPSQFTCMPCIGCLIIDAGVNAAICLIECLF